MGMFVKRSLYLFAAFVLVRAGGAHAQSMLGTAHGFSNETWFNGDRCAPCRVQGGAEVEPAAPLWNPTATTFYALYSSPTLDAPASQPGASSKLCLSCHDGTLAIENLVGEAGMTFISGPSLIGTNLSDDHPVGIEWSHQTLEAGSNKCPACHPSEDRPLPFYEGRVECPVLRRWGCGAHLGGQVPLTHRDGIA